MNHILQALKIYPPQQTYRFAGRMKTTSFEKEGMDVLVSIVAVFVSLEMMKVALVVFKVMLFKLCRILRGWMPNHYLFQDKQLILDKGAENPNEESKAVEPVSNEYPKTININVMVSHSKNNIQQENSNMVPLECIQKSDSVKYFCHTETPVDVPSYVQTAAEADVSPFDMTSQFPTGTEGDTSSIEMHSQNAVEAEVMNVSLLNSPDEPHPPNEISNQIGDGCDMPSDKPEMCKVQPTQPAGGDTAPVTPNTKSSKERKDNGLLAAEKKTGIAFRESVRSRCIQIENSVGKVKRDGAIYLVRGLRPPSQKNSGQMAPQTPPNNPKKTGQWKI